ncbi:MAG: DinB family protein [Anaerolineae bacterium]|nr:DinB family protein [Anaerolineae bacterium]
MYKAIASKPRTLAESVHIALDEMFKALETSMAGLSDEQMWSHPIDGRHSIGTIILHVFGNIDQHASYIQVGTLALDREQHDRFSVNGRPLEDFLNLTDVPGVQEIEAQLQTLKAAVFQTLDGVTDRDLYSPRYGEQTYWWTQHRRLSIDAYHRVVWHANAHVRQIWCLRGVMGAVDREHFPRQFWH